MKGSLLSVAIAAVLVSSIGTVSAQGYGSGSGMMGPGMMGGYGPGMMGPGMMGGYGSGMMGPGMMGPGMMGGYGSGMMGPGMMGSYGGIELTSDQRAKVLEIQQKLDQKHWELMGMMHQQGYRAMDFYRDGKLNEEAALKHYESMAAAQKQMFESSLKAQKEMDALLTPEQRQQLQRRWRGR